MFGLNQFINNLRKKYSVDIYAGYIINDHNKYMWIVLNAMV